MGKRIEAASGPLDSGGVQVHTEDDCTFRVPAVPSVVGGWG